MNAHIRNLRDWVILLFALFCALDVAALQYGMTLVHTGAAHPNPVIGQIVAMIDRSRGVWRDIYLTSRQATIFYGLLGGAAASLFAMLGIVVALGIQLTRAVAVERALDRRRDRLDGKRQDGA